MLKLVALVALITFAAADTSVEERLRALEEKTQKDHEEISALKAQLMNATPTLPAGALLTFADGRTVCPEGTIEPAHLKGRMMTTIPINGTSGAVFNRPFDAGEIGRTPAHSHAVSVNDPGHNHVNIVNDPGHMHGLDLWNDPGATAGGQYWGPSTDVQPPYNDCTTNTSKTGISVVALPAKSSIEVSIDANDAGEHYPLVYVLLCQKLP
jgi:hypothetical protein